MPTLHTERLLLRPFLAEDAPALAAHRSDPEIARYVPWTPPYSLEAAARLIERTRWRDEPLQPGEGAMIAVELLSRARAAKDRAVIGDCAVQMRNDPGQENAPALQATIGFTLARPHQGCGYATEAVRAILRELFTGGLFAAAPLHRVTAECGADNLASRRVLERVGMRCEAHFVEDIFFKGQWANSCHYAILRREWPERCSGGA